MVVLLLLDTASASRGETPGDPSSTVKAIRAESISLVGYVLLGTSPYISVGSGICHMSYTSNVCDV